MTLLAVLALGFFLGMRHATDSDHVVAVAAIVSRTRTRRSALWVGLLWGIGHSATVLAVGSALIWFHWAIPPRLGLSLEMGVAVMLILLGAVNLTSAASRLESAQHEHGSRLRPIAIGVVHGLAGSAAIALLVLTTIQSTRFAFAYLAVFGVGTIAGMLLITSALALPVSALNRRLRGAERQFARVAGGLSLIFGLFLAYRVGVTEGLLSATPHWVPR